MLTYLSTTWFCFEWIICCVLDRPIFTARKRSLWRLCFHRCLSAHRGGGCLPHTPWADTPLGRHPLGRDPPWTDTSLDRHNHPVHAGIQSTSGQCAFDWNAFLFLNLITNQYINGFLFLFFLSDSYSYFIGFKRVCHLFWELLPRKMEKKTYNPLEITLETLTT